MSKTHSSCLPDVLGIPVLRGKSFDLKAEQDDFSTQSLALPSGGIVGTDMERYSLKSDNRGQRPRCHVFFGSRWVF